MDGPEFIANLAQEWSMINEIETFNQGDNAEHFGGAVCFHHTEVYWMPICLKQWSAEISQSGSLGL
jgi:hypothetical protein